MKNNKIEKIYEVIKENGRALNLHEIKAMTGVGNGYNYSNNNTTCAVATTSKKSQKIYDVVTNISGKVNLHTIKAMTGAGNGYAAQNTIKSSDINNSYITESCNHKSKKINEILNTAGVRLNLHQIKAMTGAGNGYIQ